MRSKRGANCYNQEERLFVTEQQNGELDAKGAKGANSDPLDQPSRCLGVTHLAVIHTLLTIHCY
jgi:hypothetical protein